jgi:ketosteroid isomerase-like protein
MSNESIQAIRTTRSALNDAIAQRDLETIAAFFLPSYHVVTARSMQRTGKDAGVRSWADLFERDASATHETAPDEIIVNEEWGMAQELGRWTGTLMASDGPMELAGVYAAKWHNTAGGWLLQAEIFTPLRVMRK